MRVKLLLLIPFLGTLFFPQGIFANPKDLPPRQTITLAEDFINNALTIQFGRDLLVEQLNARARLFAWALGKRDWDQVRELSLHSLIRDAYVRRLKNYLGKGRTRFFPAPEIQIKTIAEYPAATVYFVHDIRPPGIQAKPRRMKMEVTWLWIQFDDRPWGWYWHGIFANEDIDTREKIAPCK